jgi:hypothetical protein
MFACLVGMETRYTDYLYSKFINNQKHQTTMHRYGNQTDFVHLITR